MTTHAKPLFESGKINSTAGIAHAFGEQMQAFKGQGPRPFVWQCLDRHLAGDWGDMDQSDSDANNEALLDGSRIFSGYLIPSDEIPAGSSDVKVWIITEAKDDKGTRSATTVLFPSEY